MEQPTFTNRYETIFIVTPVLSEDQHKETVDTYKNFVTTHGAVINYEEDWHLRKLAYPIKKKTTGYYYLVDFSGSPSVVNELEVAYKRDERILRFLTVKLDKYAIEYIDKGRKEGRKKKLHREKKDKKVKKVHPEEVIASESITAH